MTPRPNPYRTGVLFNSPQRAFATTIARLVDGVRLRDLVDDRARVELDAKVISDVIALGRARASGQQFVVPCAAANRLVNIVALRISPVPDPKVDDLIPVPAAAALHDRTDPDASAISVLHEEESVT
jgi:hypothetical protein